MKYFGSVSCLVLCVAIVFVECQENPQPPKISQPQFSLQGAGGGKDHRNFVPGFKAGVGTRVWESKKKDASLDLGVNYGRESARKDGQKFKSKPSHGFGGISRFGKK